MLQDEQGSVLLELLISFIILLLLTQISVLLYSTVIKQAKQSELVLIKNTEELNARESSTVMRN